MRRSLWIIGLVVAASLALVGFAVSSFLSSQAEENAMESLADHFHPESGWSQTDDRVRGTFLCAGVDVPCNSLLRRWNTDHRPTQSEFQGLVQAAGWNFPIHGTCQQPPNVTGSIEICSAQGIVDTYNVDVAVISDGSGGPDLVSLRIVKASS